MAISSNLGFIVGPAIAGILGSTMYKEILPVLAALVLSLITLFVIGFTLKESKPVATDTSSEKGNIGKVFAQECKECYTIVNPKKIKFQRHFQAKICFILAFLVFFYISWV